MNELSMLVSRCLAYGIRVHPFEQNTVFKMYKKYQIPDKKLLQLDRKQIRFYLKGLCLSGQEMANDWTRGHEILKELGFIEKIRKDGHRQFVSLAYIEKGDKDES